MIEQFLQYNLLYQCIAIHFGVMVVSFALSGIAFILMFLTAYSEYGGTESDESIKNREDVFKRNLSRSFLWELTILIIIFGWILPFIIHTFTKKLDRAKKNWLDRFWPYKAAKADSDKGPYR